MLTLSTIHAAATCLHESCSPLPQPCFAVMESGGSQWKVTADDIIYHNKIPGVQVNDVLEFNKVLLLGTRDDTTIGRPFVPGASVVAAVEETFKDAKVWMCCVLAMGGVVLDDFVAVCVCVCVTDTSQPVVVKNATCAHASARWVS